MQLKEIPFNLVPERRVSTEPDPTEHYGVPRVALWLFALSNPTARMLQHKTESADNQSQARR
jgi:hypothetical protein